MEDFSVKLYNYIISNDKAFEEKYPTPDIFKRALEQDEFVSDLYTHVSKRDKTFEDMFPDVGAFNDRLKKKEGGLSDVSSTSFELDDAREGIISDEILNNISLAAEVGKDVKKVREELDEMDAQYEAGETISVEYGPRDWNDIYFGADIERGYRQGESTLFRGFFNTPVTPRIRDKEKIIERSGVSLRDQSGKLKSEKDLTREMIIGLADVMNKDYADLYGGEDLVESGGFISPKALNRLILNSSEYRSYLESEAEEAEEFYRDLPSGVKEAVAVGSYPLRGLANIGTSATGFAFPTYAKHMSNKYAYIDNAVLKEAFGLSDEEVSKGVSENLVEGNYKAAAALANKMFFSDVVPSMAVAMIPYAGIPLLGMSAGGSFYADQRVRAASSRHSKAVGFLSAASVGFVEALSERIFKQDLDNIRLAFKGGIPEGVAGKVAKGYLDEFAKQGLKLVKSGAEESVEELISSLYESTVSAMLDGKEINPYEIADAAISGFFGGSFSGGMVALPSYIASTKNLREWTKLTKELDNIKKELAEGDLSQDQIDFLKERYREINSRKMEISKMDASKYVGYSEEDLEKIIELNQTIAHGLDKISNPAFGNTESIKNFIKTDLQKALDEREALEELYEDTSIQQERERLARTDEEQDQKDLEIIDEVEQGVSAVMDKINKGEDVDVNEAEDALNFILEKFDSMGESLSTTAQELIQETYNRIEGYENTYQTTTEKVTKRRPVKDSKRIFRFKDETKKRGIVARAKNALVKTINAVAGQREVLELDDNGNISIVSFDDTGKRVSKLDLGVGLNNLEFVESILDEDGNVVGVKVRTTAKVAGETVEGQTDLTEGAAAFEFEILKRNDEDSLPLDIAIDFRMSEIGQAPESEQLEFEEYVEEVVTKTKVKPKVEGEIEVREEEATDQKNDFEESNPIEDQEGRKDFIRKNAGNMGRKLLNVIDKVQRMVSNLGYEIVLVSNNEMGNMEGEGGFDSDGNASRGNIVGKKIYINVQDGRDLAGTIVEKDPDIAVLRREFQEESLLRAVYHEGFHALFIEAFGASPKALRDFKDSLVKAIRSQMSEADANKLIGRLEDFTEQYAVEGQTELTDEQVDEFITELAAMMATGGMRVGDTFIEAPMLKYPTLAGQIRKIINDLLEKLGVSYRLKGDDDIIQFMNNAARGMRMGKKGMDIIEQTEKLLEDEHIRKQIGERRGRQSRRENLAPNGKPSNLNDEQYRIVRTPEFKKWFGDWENDPDGETTSKAVDENGEPLVLYHGTDNGKFVDESGIFDSPLSRKKYFPWNNWGSYAQLNENQGVFFFSDDPKVSATYMRSAINTNRRLLPVFLSTNNPLVVDGEGKAYAFPQRMDNISRSDGIINIFQEAKIKEKDAVIIKNVKDDYYAKTITNTYTVFQSNQIKLADGSNTTFDSNNLDIRKARRETLDVVENSPSHISNAFETARKSPATVNIEFKDELQEIFENETKPLIQENYGVEDFDTFERSNEPLTDYLTDAFVSEVREAYDNFKQAIGWYDAKTKAAMDVMSLIHPELATDIDANNLFKMAVAITSNGNKVDQNFREADRQYRYYKKNGKFDEVRSLGSQSSSIKSTFQWLNEALEDMTVAELVEFMTTKMKAGDLFYYVKKGDKISKVTLIGDHTVDTEVYGASVLGPKIGNGFFMNLYGEYEMLTMDRWFIRTFGRLTGTLIARNPALIKSNEKRVRAAFEALTAQERKTLRSIIGSYKVTGETIPAVTKKIQNKSSKLEVRQAFWGQETSAKTRLDELRMASISYRKNLGGEVEDPKNGRRRNYIKSIFDDVQQILKDEYGLDFTMADIQAVIWYPEKALYDEYKKGKDVKETDEAGDEQPDYENAAKKLARKNNITEKQIKDAIRRKPTAELEQGGTQELDTSDERKGEVRKRVVQAKAGNKYDKLLNEAKSRKSKRENLITLEGRGKQITTTLNEDRPISVLPLPERYMKGFTGRTLTEKERNSNLYEIGQKFPYKKGGVYVDMRDKSSSMDSYVASSGKIHIDLKTGLPKLSVSENEVDRAVGVRESKKAGRKGTRIIKTNLFRKKGKWDWKYASRGLKENVNKTIVSIETGGHHIYALSFESTTPLELKNYGNEASEPRLRPTTAGAIFLGTQVGEIKVGSKVHPVFEQVISYDPNDPSVVERLAYSQSKGDQEFNQQYYDRFNQKPLRNPTDELFKDINGYVLKTLGFEGAKKIGSGIEADVYDIGGGRVIRIADSTSGFLDEIAGKKYTPEGFLRVYSTGRIQVPQKMTVKTLMGGRYRKNPVVDYAIIEKVDANRKISNDLEKTLIVAEDYLNIKKGYSNFYDVYKKYKELSDTERRGFEQKLLRTEEYYEDIKVRNKVIDLRIDRLSKQLVKMQDEFNRQIDETEEIIALSLEDRYNLNQKLKDESKDYKEVSDKIGDLLKQYKEVVDVLSREQFNDFRRIMRIFDNAENFGIKLIDAHTGNFGRDKNGDVVFIDYGMVRRTDRTDFTAQPKTIVRRSKRTKASFDSATEKRTKGKTEPLISNLDKKRGKIRGLALVTKALFDRQGTIRRMIKESGNKVLEAALSTRLGSSAYAKHIFDRESMDIFSGVFGNKLEYLNEMITLRRIISIEDGIPSKIERLREMKEEESKGKNRASVIKKINQQIQDLTRFKHPNNHTRETALERISEIRDDIGNDEQFFDIEERVQKYFDVMQDVLRRKYQEGLIDSDTYEALRKYEYSPRIFIDKIFDVENGDFSRKRDTFMRSYGLSEAEFKRLSTGSTNELFDDAEYLLRMVLAANESRIFSNRFFKKLAKAEGLNWVSDTKRDGFREIKYKDKGEVKSLFVRKDLADEIEFPNDGIERTVAGDWARKLSFSGILRAMATGYNPLFPFSNIPMDFANIIFFTDVYDNKGLTHAMGSLGVQFLKNSMGLRLKNPETLSRLEEALEAGMGMDFLTNQGRLKYGSKSSNVALKAVKDFGKIVGSFSENSELGMRLAVYEKVKDESKEKRKEAQKNMDSLEDEIEAIESKDKMNSSDKKRLNELKDQLQFGLMSDSEIKAYAAYKARATIDFSKGGVLAKNIDGYVPYFNASLQALSVAGSYAAENPAKLMEKVGKAGFSLAVLTFVGRVLAEFGGWDDDDEDAIPPDERKNYFTFRLPWEDEDGNKEYFRIRKNPQLSPFLMPFETLGNAVYMAMKGKSNKEISDFVDKRMAMGLNQVLEATMIGDAMMQVNEETLDVEVSLMGAAQYTPTLLKAFFQYQTGFDFFREKPVSPYKSQVDRGDISIGYEGRADANVQDFYKRWTEHTLGTPMEMSPARVKNFTETIITSPSTNLLVALGYSILDNDWSLTQKLGQRRFIRSANKNYTRIVQDPEYIERKQKMNAEHNQIRSDVGRMVRKKDFKYEEFQEYLSKIEDPELRAFAEEKYTENAVKKNAFREEAVLQSKAQYLEFSNYLKTDKEFAAKWLFENFGVLSNEELNEISYIVGELRGGGPVKYPKEFMYEYRRLEQEMK